MGIPCYWSKIILSTLEIILIVMRVGERRTSYFVHFLLSLFCNHSKWAGVGRGGGGGGVGKERGSKSEGEGRGRKRRGEGRG